MKRSIFASLSVVIAFAAMVAGCGQKGPLYLPDEEGTVVTRPGTQQPSPDEEEEGRTQRPQQPPPR